MSNSNLLPLVVAMSVAESLEEQLEQFDTVFQDAMTDVITLVNGLRTQPVVPEAAAAFEKVSATD